MITSNIKRQLRKIFSIKDNQMKRDEWVKAELSKIKPGKIILDAGCGDQIYRKYCDHLNYKGQDFGEYDGMGSGEGLQLKNWQYGKLDYTGDIWKINEKDETFDAVLCTEVFEHIPYPNESIREFSRLLRPGGVLLLTSPFTSLPHMQPYYFYSGFSKEYYNYFLQLNGFEIIGIEHNGNAFDFVAQELLRTKQFVNNVLLNVPYQLIIYGLMIPILKLLSNFDRVSHKSLVFGYHVKAIKKTKSKMDNTSD